MRMGPPAGINTMQSNTNSGPQLTFSTEQLSMIAPKNQIQQDSVVVKNIGSTTVSYEWQKNHRGDFIPSKKSDFAQRFWCHYPRAILKPGESKMFTFSFASEKVGMFKEEWELWTEPLVLNRLPILELCGISTEEDKLTKAREQFWDQFDTDFMAVDALENVEGMVDVVRTPLKAPKNYLDPETFKEAFELRNRDMGVYFTQPTMDACYELLGDIATIWKRQEREDLDDVFTWGITLLEIEHLILKIKIPTLKSR